MIEADMTCLGRMSGDIDACVLCASDQTVSSRTQPGFRFARVKVNGVGQQQETARFPSKLNRSAVSNVKHRSAFLLLTKTLPFSFTRRVSLYMAFRLANGNFNFIDTGMDVFVSVSALCIPGNTSCLQISA